MFKSDVGKKLAVAMATFTKTKESLISIIEDCDVEYDNLSNKLSAAQKKFDVVKNTVTDERSNLDDTKVASEAYLANIETILNVTKKEEV